MEQYKKRAPAVWYAVCALLVLLLLSTMRFGVSLSARYTTSSSGSDQARVALFVSEQTMTFDLSEIKKPGDTKSFSITIANFDGEKVCEVTQRYTLTANTQNNLPLAVTIDKATTGTFEAGTKQSVTYTITVTWENENAADRNYLYANEIDVLVLTVDAAQVD